MEDNEFESFNKAKKFAKQLFDLENNVYIFECRNKDNINYPFFSVTLNKTFEHANNNVKVELIQSYKHEI